MTTQVYHVKLNPQERTALVSLHYIGTTMARAIKNGNATPAQRKTLYQEWLHYLSQVEPVLNKK